MKRCKVKVCKVKRDRAKLSTRHLPIKEGLVGGAEGVGDGWWRVGNHQVKLRRQTCQRHKRQWDGVRKSDGEGRIGGSIRTGRVVSCSDNGHPG